MFRLVFQEILHQNSPDALTVVLVCGVFDGNISIRVTRYLRASFTVTDTQVSGQPAEVREESGSDSAQGVLLSLPRPSSFPSRCDIAEDRRKLDK